MKRVNHPTMNDKFNFRKACALGKHNALPFHDSNTQYNNLWQLIVCDL